MKQWNYMHLIEYPEFAINIIWKEHFIEILTIAWVRAIFHTFDRKSCAVTICYNKT